ncbi:uncharacterized protein LOC108150786 [Drosophila miranda]|uniref:uncharacterized protein LOC108150786 n=1 Tax=Drosophila miranda TaxID=7229 RepID=UPI0007E6797C|nr:uncharacterized protein LOC108150786 [Drosophila miranda]
MSPSALALVLYNVLLYLGASDIKANVVDKGDNQYTIFYLIKTVGKWMMNRRMDETSSEFGDMFWSINAGVNVLLLVPAFVQHRGLRTWIVPMVYICNLFVLHRLQVYCLVAAFTLWRQEMYNSFSMLIVCSLCMSCLHLALICTSMKFAVVE